MNLEQIGWNEFFREAFRPHDNHANQPARLCCAGRGRYLAFTESGETALHLGGRLRRMLQESGDWPVTGDWVAAGEGGAIHAILPRRTGLARKEPGPAARRQVLAANIDFVFLIAGLDRDFNPRRLERALVLVRESGATPIILLNKADLCPDPDLAFEQAGRAAAGTEVIVISAATGQGVAELERRLAPGETAALIGSSGAGKSTLANRLLGRVRQRVSEVREHDGRGRHTTAQRELILMPRGWLLMDLPGLREIQLWGDPASVDQAFADISTLAESCRFGDCRHQDEPGCAVRRAIEEETLSSARLQNYAKVRRELDHLERKRDERAAEEEKRRVKRAALVLREIMRRKKGP